MLGGQRGSLRPATFLSPLSPGHPHLIVPVTVRPIPRLCRPAGEPGAEYGPTWAKDVLAEIPEQLLSYMRTRDIQPRRHSCHPQPNASSKASLNSPPNQCPAVCPPAHPLLLLKIRGTWTWTSLGGQLEDQYWLVEPSAPSPTEGPGTVTTSWLLPIIKLIFYPLLSHGSWGGRLGHPGSGTHEEKRWSKDSFS